MLLPIHPETKKRRFRLTMLNDKKFPVYIYVSSSGSASELLSCLFTVYPGWALKQVKEL